MTQFRIACFLVTIFTAFTNLYAQEEQVLDPVTVTASLQPTQVSRTGRNIVVIPGNRFYTLPVHSVAELLRYIPGVEAQARGPMGTQSDLSIRGSTFQQVLIVIDGVRLNDPNTGHFNAYIPIAPSEISRIEVLKGASSAIYGSEAVGGVVHIITKTFAASQGEKAKELHAGAAVGEYGFISGNAGVFYNNGKSVISAGGVSNSSDGQTLRGTRGDFGLHNGTISLNHFFNESLRLSIRTGYDYRQFAAQNYYTTFLSDTANETVKTSWNHLHLAYTKSKNSLSLDAGYKFLDDAFYFNPKSIPNLNKTKLGQILLQDQHRFSEKTVLTAGAQWLYRSIRSNDRGRHHENQAALFTVLTHAAGQLRFSPALRVDWHEQRGMEWIPQLNIGYQLNRWGIRASAGRTIRDADFTERYNNYGKPIVTSGRIGNPALEAEHSWSYEAGVDVLPVKGLKIAHSFFRRHHKQLIDYALTPYADMPRKENLVATGNYLLAKNLARVVTSGMETDVQLQLTPGMNQTITAATGLLLLDTENDEASALYVSSHPSMMVNFQLAYQYSRFQISFSGLYKKRAEQTATAINAKLDDSYFVLNGRLGFYLWRNRLSVYMQADNLFDRNYSDLLGARMPGRWLMGGAQLTL